MRLDARKIGTCALSAVMAFGMFALPVSAGSDINNAIKTTNAGLTASLEQGYYDDGLVLGDKPADNESDAKLTREEIAECLAGYNDLGIAKVDGHLNVREKPSTGSNVEGKLPSDAGCEILEQEGDWYLISSGKVKGYVSGEFLLTGDEAREYARGVMHKVVTSKADALRVREEPNTDSKIIMTISNGEEFELAAIEGDWVKVDVNGDFGYIAAEYVDIAVKLKHAYTIAELNYGPGVSSIRVKLVQEALKYVGNRYVWGGTSLTNGADCSGYVLALYKKICGISLPHYSGSQSKYGRGINAADAKPGDLFFYGSGRSISHVAIYIGNGQIVHAYDSRNGIKITSAYYRTPICVRSLLD
ncbi:MAG: SH3 domain-containing protein [Lachnospiraceae bacterium]|nr:SH3 domain-containing protein [Lachnospiraceae bacterium]